MSNQEKKTRTNRIARRLGGIFIFALLSVFNKVVEAEELALLNAMEKETARAVATFKQMTPPMYYLACGVTDTENIRIRADFGAVTSDSRNRSRELDIDARCGSFKRDNTHPLPGYTWDYRWFSHTVPVDDKAVPIRMALWRAIESEYRIAAERYAQVKAMDVTKAALRDKSDDFSQWKAETMIQPRIALAVDREAWRDKLKYCTLPLKKYPSVYQGKATFQANTVTRTFVNSEGSKLQFSRASYLVSLSVITRSEDGLDIPLYKSFFAWNPADLPSRDELRNCAVQLAETTKKLRKAPFVDPYSGPAIMQGGRLRFLCMKCLVIDLKDTGRKTKRRARPSGQWLEKG